MSDRFTEMANRNASFMYRIAYSLLRNTHDAQDAVQDSLLKLFRLGGWQNARDERAFLARAVWRCSLQRLPRSQFLAIQVETIPMAATSRSPEEDAIVACNEDRLHRLINALPLDLREPLLLSGFQELTSSQIAGVLGIPEGTVRTRLKRAREELKRRW